MKAAPVTLAFLVLAAPLFAQSPDAADVPTKSKSLWQLVMDGGPMMIPLGVLSVITVMLIIILLFTLTRRSIVTARYMQTADALIRKKDYLGLVAVSHRHNEAVARIMERTMDFLDKHPRGTLAEAREIAQTEGARQASAMNQQVAYLADIGTLSPMLGLLGTVIGIIQSFSVITMDAAATRPTLLAHGVGEALIVTAAGLLVGIPAMAAYAYFRGRSQALISDLEAATTHLMALLSSSSSTSRREGREADLVR